MRQRLRARGSAAAGLDELCARRGFGAVVIKPAISAASRGTKLFTAAQRAEGDSHLRELLASGDALVQPYLEAVEARGERSFVWIDGELTHAVRK